MLSALGKHFVTYRIKLSVVYKNYYYIILNRNFDHKVLFNKKNCVFNFVYK